MPHLSWILLAIQKALLDAAKAGDLQFDMQPQQFVTRCVLMACAHFLVAIFFAWRAKRPRPSILRRIRANDPSLTHLFIRGDGLGDDDVKELVAALKDNDHVTFLNLVLNDIGPEGAKPLAEFLQNNRSITALYLCLNNIGPEGAKVLGKLLQGNKTIATLGLGAVILGSNRFGPEGVKALAEGLPDNQTLTKLLLNLNEIGTEGAEALAKVLPDNDTIVELGLMFNDIGPEGLEAISKALQYNATITRIDLEGNGFDQESPAYRNIQYILAMNQAGRRVLLHEDNDEVLHRLYPIMLERVTDNEGALYGLLQERMNLWCE